MFFLSFVFEFLRPISVSTCLVAILCFWQPINQNVLLLCFLIVFYKLPLYQVRMTSKLLQHWMRNFTWTVLSFRRFQMYRVKVFVRTLQNQLRMQMLCHLMKPTRNAASNNALWMLAFLLLPTFLLMCQSCSRHRSIPQVSCHFCKRDQWINVMWSLVVNYEVY